KHGPAPMGADRAVGLAAYLLAVRCRKGRRDPAHLLFHRRHLPQRRPDHRQVTGFTPEFRTGHKGAPPCYRNRAPMSVSLATWNINSVRLRLPLVLDFLAKYQPDVLCLQEIK